MSIIIQTAVGFCGMFLCLICYQFSQQKKVLIAKLFADIFWGTHYYLVGGYAGMITNIICAMRETTYLIDKNENRRKIWLGVFIVIGWVLSYFKWQGIASILPTMAFTLGAYSFWQKNVNVTRVLAVIIAIMMLSYNICVKSYIGMLNESLTILTVLSALLKHSSLKNSWHKHAHKYAHK